MPFKNKQLLLILTLAPVFFVSCRAFGNFWENSKEQKITYTDPSDTVAPTMPAAPSGVSGGSTQLNLSWTAASDNTNQPSALIYEICQSLVAGSCNTFSVTFVTAAGATSFNATGLNPSTTYYYRVRARDTAGNAGPETAEFSATTAAAGTVNTPTYSPVAGTFNSAQLVTISSSTPGATLCYTTDGVTTPACNAVPTCTTGTTYAAAVNVSVTTTLKTIACKNGSTDSAVANGVFTIDSTPPTVSNVSSSTSNGTLGVGQTISIQVTFSEPVNVTGTPQLTLATGSPATTAVNYVSGTGTSTLTFDYVTASGNFSGDLDYASTGALALNGGSIQDAAGNAAVLTLALPGAAGSLGANKALIIDGVGPAVTGVTASNADTLYGSGSIINVQVNFNEAVVVTGTPQLILSTGSPATTAVNYTSGSGTTTLLFNYAVAAGNMTADLDYNNAAALTLNGGTMLDSLGNAATLTLVTPGTPGSLGNSKDISIDGSGPTIGAAISFSAITLTGLTVNWGLATDNITPQANLQYKVVKDDVAPGNLGTIAMADAKMGGDLLQDWTTNIATKVVTGLTASTTYHFAVLVRDGAGNRSLYAAATQATSGGANARRLIVCGASTNTSIYDSGTHSFSPGPAFGATAGNQGYSFPVTTGVQAGKIIAVVGAATTTRLYDIGLNSFTAGATIAGAGAGATSFDITSGSKAGQRLIMWGANSSTRYYDPSLDSFATAGPTLSFTHSAGGHYFHITSGPQSGKTMIVHGGSNIYTSLFDPGTLLAPAGPDLTANAAAGAHAFAITTGGQAGKTLVVHGSGTATSLYDPATNTFSSGPLLSGAAGVGGLSFAITTGPQAGKRLVVHGNSAATSYYDPGTNGFTGGPTLSGTVGAGGQAFLINAGAQSGKTLVIHGGATTGTTLFDPSGPGVTPGPTVSASVTTASHSWDIP